MSIYFSYLKTPAPAGSSPNSLIWPSSPFIIYCYSTSPTLCPSNLLTFFFPSLPYVTSDYLPFLKHALTFFHILLMYTIHIIRSTKLKCTTQWLFMYVYTRSKSRTFLSSRWLPYTPLSPYLHYFDFHQQRFVCSLT